LSLDELLSVIIELGLENVEKPPSDAELNLPARIRGLDLSKPNVYQAAEALETRSHSEIPLS